jgi:uncharacterized protein
VRIPVTDLLGHPGAARAVEATVSRDDVDAQPGAWGPADEALDSPIQLDLRLEMLVDGLMVRGHLRFTTRVACARCLTDVVTDHDLPVAELYTDPRKPGNDDDEIEPGYQLEPEGEIDLEALLRDTVLSTVPLRTLCQEECAGLCPVCGADLNVEDCGHDPSPGPDPRWAALQQLDLPPG